jgi:hypothetical protein
VAGVKEARRVLARLDRVDELRRRSGGASLLLGEIQLLLAEAEEWVRIDRADERAREAVGHMRTALDEAGRAPLGPKRTLVA